MATTDAETELPSNCFICGDDTPSRLQTHHIVPRRYGGSDEVENLVRLCASCHQAVEKLYDERFYHRLGVNLTSDEDEGMNVVAPLDSPMNLDKNQLYVVRNRDEQRSIRRYKRLKRERDWKGGDSRIFVDVVTGRQIECYEDTLTVECNNDGIVCVWIGIYHPPRL